MNCKNLDNEKPEKDQFVLVYTKHCSYPWDIARWTGLKLVSVNDDEEYGSFGSDTKFWMDLPEKPESEQ